MRIAVVCEAEIAHGGGFNQAVSAALQFKRIAADSLTLTVVRHETTAAALQPLLGGEILCYRRKVSDYIAIALHRLDGSNEMQRSLKRLSGFERMLLRRGIDLVYFVTPSPHAMLLQQLNFIFTCWDTCHRDAPEFPEVRHHHEGGWRDYLLTRTLPQAFLTLVDSPALAERIVARYGIDRRRLLAMPFSAAPRLSGTTDLSRPLATDSYFYYPAQFWSHKNHVRIIEALALLKAGGDIAKVAFSGGDIGCLEHVRARAQDAGVIDQIEFVGFVPPEAIADLYARAAAVLMPSYFGPTNIPPIEAWTMGRPLVCSDVMAEQVGDAAILFDPDDAHALADAMRRVSDPSVARALVEKGNRRLAELSSIRAAAETDLLDRINSFAARRACWA